MSLSARSVTKTKIAKLGRIQAIEADMEILEYLEGCLELDGCKPWELSSWEFEELRNCDLDRAKEILKGKSNAAKWIADRARNYHPDQDQTLGELLKKWGLRKRLVQWMRENENLMREVGLAVSRYGESCSHSRYGGEEWTKFFPASLLGIGCESVRDAQKFVELYREVQIKNRQFLSSYQPDQSRVCEIATTPNYGRLPLWVKKGLVNAPRHAGIAGDRIGNIWRLPDCVRAWKWAQLPKGIAEKVGKLPVRSRILAAIAWREIGSPNFCAYHERGWVEQEYDYNENCTVEWAVHRSNMIDKFWVKYREFERKPLASLLKDIMHMGWGSQKTRSVIEIFLDSPYESLSDEWANGERDENDRKKPSSDRILEIICTYGNPKEACHHLFSVNGKGTVKAFQKCQNKDAWKWASALASGNADAVQKILASDSLIAWESDAVDFLLSLPLVSRLRMLQATTFKYRGQVCEVSPDHIRDTGYLWKNIQSKPELGRIRCWFSVHEQLAAEFVKELPDEALPIPAGWERLDGLCAVDGSWELEFPKRIATLKYYGEILHNCVGGYGPAIKQGRSVIFVVREQGQLTHCVEYEGGTCRQFYRAHNGNPDRAVKESVQGAIAQAMNW